MNPENKKLVIFDFDGVLNRGNLKDTIISLSSKYFMAVVSSSSDKYISNYLTNDGLEKYFSDILGSDTYRSKIIKINSLLKKYGTSSKDVVYVTDSLDDIKDGNECGIKSIGVTWGIHPKENLKKGNPIAIIDNPNDLLDTVNNMLK